MRGRLLVTACTAVACCVGTVEAGVWDKVKSALSSKKEEKAPSIKVLVEKDVPGCLLEVQGRYNIYDPYSGKRISTRFVPKSNYMQPVIEGLKWGEVFPGTFQLAIVPDNPQATVSINGIQYRGAVIVYNIDGKLNVVNDVAVEDYVHSILTTQFAGSGDSEALAALAIAARSDACYQAMRSRNPYFDVVADDVGYEGHAVTSPGSDVAKAMRSTRQLVLSYNRAYQGDLTPLLTFCLDREFGDASAPGHWDYSKACELASSGLNASKILEQFYPDASVELMSSLPPATLAPSVPGNEVITEADQYDEYGKIIAR